MRYRARLAYDGGAYQGFQRQLVGRPTIQSALEEAIQQVTGEQTTVIGAGRTDAGVHATGQVIAFTVERWARGESTLLKALNGTLPKDIALQDLALAEPDFHPRFDAAARLYRYRVLNAPQPQPLLRGSSWWVWRQVDGAAMQVAAGRLIGQHDCAAFGTPPRPGSNTVRRVIQSGWAIEESPCGPLWVYTVEAEAFLKHMVRRMVAALVAVGRGEWSLGEFEGRFRAGVLIDSLPLAPPQGLTLEAVTYTPESKRSNRRVATSADDDL
jgi:tRNA pseudouridine38-40 synthase